MSAIKKLSAFCYKIANEGGQLKGSVIVSPVQEYEQLLLEMGKEAVVGFEYLGARVIPKQDAFEFEFIANDLSAVLSEEEQAVFNKAINSEIARRARAHYDEVQARIQEVLAKRGITFADKKAFIEFCKSQLSAIKQGNETQIKYEQETIYSFSDTKIFQHDKNN